MNLFKHQVCANCGLETGKSATDKGLRFPGGGGEWLCWALVCEGEPEDWISRALAAERQIERIRAACRALGRKTTRTATAKAIS